MKAQLIKIELDSKGRYWFNNYTYKCIDCGEEFTRHTCNDRINPYCGNCSRKRETIKQRERNQKKLEQEYEKGLAAGYRMALEDLDIIGKGDKMNNGYERRVWEEHHEKFRTE